MAHGPKELVRSLTWLGLERIKANSPVRTGEYRDKWFAKLVDGGFGGVIKHRWSSTRKGVQRLLAIEFGAKDHIIQMRKKVLHFQFKSGEEGFRQQVHHPGMTGFGARTRTESELRRYITRVRKAFLKAFQKTLKG